MRAPAPSPDGSRPSSGPPPPPGERRNGRARAIRVGEADSGIGHWRKSAISGSAYRERRREFGPMDFDLTERQAFYRDRVKDFIETRIRPRVGDYKSQLNQGDRWQPLP